MTYLRPHNHARVRRNRLIAAFAVVIAFCVGLTQFFAPHIFPAFATAIAKPFWRMQFAVSSGAFRPPAEILAENEALKREIFDLRMNYASSSIALLEDRNRELTAWFSRASTSPRQYVIGAVLSRPGTLPYDELIIDAGKADGIASTSRVYAPGMILIGQVRELLAHSAKIILYSSPRQTYSVVIGSKHIPATAIGRGGGQYRAEVPHGSLVRAGDIVADSSLYDRAFGVVTSVITDPSNPFDTVLFAPPVNINELRFVLVD